MQASTIDGHLLAIKNFYRATHGFEFVIQHYSGRWAP